MTGWSEHGHARKTGLPIDTVLGRGDLQDAENCGYNPIGILATMRVCPQTKHGDPVDQFRAGRIELLDGTILERGGALGSVWAVTRLPALCPVCYPPRWDDFPPPEISLRPDACPVRQRHDWITRMHELLGQRLPGDPIALDLQAAIDKARTVEP